MPLKSLQTAQVVLDALDSAVLILSADHHQVLSANPSARRLLLGDADAEFVESWQQHLTSQQKSLLDALIQLLRAPQPQQTQHALLTTPHPRFLNINSQACELEGQPVVIFQLRDMTHEAVLEDKLTKSYSLYQSLASANQALLTATDEATLFTRLCQAATKAYTLRLAWIGRIENDSVQPLFWAGSANGYLDHLKISFTDPELAVGPIPQALRERSVVHVNDIEHDPRFRPWRDAAMRSGLLSMAVVPIWDGNNIFGVMVVYSTRVDSFDPPLVRLLESIGADISLALANIRANQQRLQAEAQLSELSQAIEQSGSAVVIVDLQGVIQYCNPKFYETTGYRQDEVQGQTLALLRGDSTTLEDIRKIQAILLQGGTWSGELENRRKSGDSFWSRQTVSPLLDANGNIYRYIITGEDYTSLHNAQQMVQQLAYYDALTNLPNRRLFMDRLNQACQTSTRYGYKLALLYLDLDGFKQVNDSLGHAAGDELLVEIANRLRNTLRSVDSIARLGGDEFVVLVDHLEDSERVNVVAQKVLEAIAMPMVLREFKVEVSASIGITVFPEDGTDVDRLMRNADMAMYVAKSKGRNNFQCYTESMNERFVRKLALENRLRVAIENEEFELHYQPQIDLHSGQLEGFEALVRWIDPEQGTIAPDEFIPLAEESGLIVALGDLVIRMACAQARQFQQRRQQLKVAINLSAYQFGRSETLLKSLQRELIEEHLDPAYIELELTESTLIENIDETISVLEEFQRFGFSVAIDDFGTGYSSLSYLKSLPINLLKIDRKFIREIPQDSNDAAITAAVIAMAHELGIRVLAEGVEIAEQLAFLQQHGCDQAQGYFFSPPLPVAKLDAFISSYQPLQQCKLQRSRP